EELIEILLVPDEPGLCHCRRVSKAGETAGLAAEDGGQGRSEAALPDLDRVARRALVGKHRLPRGGVARGVCLPEEKKRGGEHERCQYDADPPTFGSNRRRPYCASRRQRDTGAER